MDENSERHFMTTTYIHKLNLGVNMAYNMKHALTGFAQTCKNLTLVLKKVPFVLEFCKIILENMNLTLKNIKIQPVLSDLWDAHKKITKKLIEIARYTSKSQLQLVFYSIQFVQ